MDLSLIPLHDLADELMRRGTCGIVMVTTIDKKQIYFNWVGEYHEALGLTVDMADIIKKETKET